jgi:hypothetical protein
MVLWSDEAAEEATASAAADGVVDGVVAGADQRWRFFGTLGLVADILL